MKQLLILFLNLILIKCAFAQGLTRYGEISSNGAIYINRHGAAGTGTGMNVSGKMVTTLNVGDDYQGGKIAYILTPADPGYDPNILHGLISDVADLSNLRWGTEGLTASGADGTAVGTGYQNTLDIIAADAQGAAAASCRASTNGGYNDWYLPSRDELNKLYINRTAIGGFNASGWYWSSTESSAVYAWYQDFSNGTQGSTGAHKDWALSIRAIRSF